MNALIEALDLADSRREAVLVALIGSGIQASRTPALHEREGAAHGLRYVYRRVDLERLGLGPAALPELIEAARRFGFAGLNVTHPCKQSVIAHLRSLSREARRLGAVNTIVFGEDGGAVGHNTDWHGFAAAFRRELGDVARGRVVLFGAGGAGAAVGHALGTLGVGEIAIVDSVLARAEGLARDLVDRVAARAIAPDTLGAALAAADGVVNATPIGMAKYPGTPLDPALLQPEHWVVDIVYFPLETALLRAARARGCRTMGGGGMAVFQAAEAFRLFTGRAANAARMLDHFAAMGGDDA